MEETRLEVYLAACGAEGCEPNVHVSELLARPSPLIELAACEQPLGRRGGAALAAVLSRDRDVTVLRLESCELHDAGLQAVCEALARHPSVFRLDLGYNGLRELRPIGRLLELSPSLLCVDLSGNSLRPSLLGWSPIQPLAASLASELCRVQLLQLGNCDLGPRGVEALADGLQSNACAPACVRNVFCRSRRMRSARTPALRSRGRSSHTAHPASLDHPCNRQRSSVLNLALDENSLGVRAAAALGRLLVANRTLTSLDLRHNALGDEGAAALAPALETNRTLGCLVLWGNRIGPAGACALAVSVGLNGASARHAPSLYGREGGSGLEVLDLGENELTAAAADAFKAALGAARAGAHGARAPAAALRRRRHHHRRHHRRVTCRVRSVAGRGHRSRRHRSRRHCSRRRCGQASTAGCTPSASRAASSVRRG